MIHFRYAILLITTCLITLATYSQTLTTISNHTVLISPSYTINSGATYTVTGEVKNTGTSTINNNVHINVAIDTSSTFGLHKYYWRATKTYSVTNFNPNNTFAFSVSDAATPPNGYKTSGNGVSVVVWTSVGFLPNDSTTTLDSVFTTIYILPLPQSINDNHFETTPIHIQNPAHSVLNFSISDLKFDEINLLNSDGKLIEKFNNTDLRFNVSHLPIGIYFLSFYNQEKNKYFTKKIIIN